MKNLLVLIPLLPFLGFLLNGLFGKRFSKTMGGLVATLVVAASFACSILVFTEVSAGDGTPIILDVFQWIRSGGLSIGFSLMADPLTALFLLIITGIGSLIHLYSMGYMHDDENHNKFFSYLNLFVFFMLLLVMGSNYVVMFVGWEGVGLCSYLLIGFWFKNPPYNDAAKKAFVMNRIGDLGFLLGIFLLFTQFNTVNYFGDTGIFAQAVNMASNEGVLVAITLLLFIGATGKSAQIPLYTWLPDAMAGPTPVSALIHAATMVTAGIYMIARSNILFTLAPDTLHIIAYTGGFTALIAAFIGMVQNDIKKVLAYSTVSQLGLMFLALGLGSYVAAVFHVMTHAFFKGLLFLGSGSVIHAAGGEQDIRKLGGLKKALPVTHATFLIGTLAISGVPPFAGFFSKDEILASAFAHDKLLWMLGIGTSALTVFYMFRLYFLTFHGQFRGTHHQRDHLHESPSSMTIPLVILAVLSVFGGVLGMPAVMHVPHWLAGFLDPVMQAGQARMLPMHLDHATEWSLMGATLLMIVIMFFLARNKYITSGELPAEEGVPVGRFHAMAYGKFFVDECYNALIVKPWLWVSGKLKDVVEKQIIDGLIQFSATSVQFLAGYFRQIQSGSVGLYLFGMVAGIIFILFYLRIF